MTRFIAAVVLVSLAAARGEAQPVPIAPPGPGARPVPVPVVPPGPGARLAPTPVPMRAPIVIPVTSAKPPAGYYKSGGVLVGADGYYPFDTGPYLLGGFEGLTRYSGTYVMVPGAVAHPPVASGPVPVEFAPAAVPRGRFFHRK